MARIVPFRALRYSREKVGDLASVMAPPYDVIPPVLQEDLYRRSPYNIVRLILGRTEKSDTEIDNRYTRAAADFADWQARAVLLRDAAPALYLYDQTYALEDGSKVVRKGFIALTRIEDFSSGVVKPHEKTLAGPKADRLLLTRACSANFSPIFSLYSDPSCALESLGRRFRDEAPAVDVADDDGVRHCLWPVADETFIAHASDLLDSRPLFIADGHHRYETALNYRNEMRAANPKFSGRELYNYVLMYFANMDDQGMTIFPTHRVIFGLDNFDVQPFIEILKKNFLVTERQIDTASPEACALLRDELAARGKELRTIGCYLGDGRFLFLSLRDEKSMDRFFPPRSPQALRTLDVSILHRLILEEELQISSAAQEAQTNLRYVKGFAEPFAMVDRKEGQIAFLLNPTRMSEVRDVANAGEKMPQKSTYFYPKLLSGLVISRFWPGESATPAADLPE